MFMGTGVISVIILLCTISSGSVICAAKYRKRYEEVLPVTCAACVFLLFIFGLLGILEAGVYIVLGLSVLAYVWSAIYMSKKRNSKEFVTNFFTPAFFCFVILTAIFVYSIYGKLLDSWDEFSHWGDIVKVMTTLDDFGTNPQSFSTFKSYPPGMTLFQYLLQKVNMLISGEQFSEWLIYVAWQMLAMAFLMPLLNKLSFKKPVTIIAAIVTCFFAPWMFFANIFTAVYIDGFLGLLTGAGLAMVFLHEREDAFYTSGIISVCCMLVMAKDSGMLFAVFVAGAYILDKISFHKSVGWSWKAFGFSVAGPMLAVILPKLLWNMHLALRHIGKSFAAKYELSKLFAYFTDESYWHERAVIMNFYKAFTTRTIDLQGRVSYLLATVLFVVVAAVLIWVVQRKEGKRKGCLLRMTVIISSLLVVYVAGLLLTYLFRFGDYEALRLASFERYMNTVYLAIWMFILLVTIYACCLWQNGKAAIMCAILFLIVVGSAPIHDIREYFHRKPVENSIEVRANYEKVVSEIEYYSDGNDKIFFVSQEDNGFDYWVVRFSVRPNVFGDGNWSIGEPFYAGDVWTKTITAKEWQNLLVEEYDMVALYELNDYFLEEFAGIFANPEDVAENTVYRVNKETKLLERYE